MLPTIAASGPTMSHHSRIKRCIPPYEYGRYRSRPCRGSNGQIWSTRRFCGSAADRRRRSLVRDRNIDAARLRAVSAVLTMNRTLPGKFDAAAIAVEDVRSAIFPGVAEMHSLIAMVLAMRSAPALRARMHELMHIADDRPFLLSRFQGTVWIEVGTESRLQVLRKQVSGLPFADIDQGLPAEPTLTEPIKATSAEPVAT